MGLFDFFKKKEQEPAPVSPPPPQEVNYSHLLPRQDISKAAQDEAYAILQPYGGHIMLFLNMQLSGNFAPIAAYEDMNGEVNGFLYMAEDPTYNISVEETLEKMEEEFEKRMAEQSIRSYSILYHSRYSDHNDDHSVADNPDEFRAISIRYKGSNDSAGSAALPYLYIDDEVRFGGISALSKAQSDAIFNTGLQDGKDYFAEKVSLQPPAEENEAGITIVKSNHGTLGSLWAGILGYERMESADGLLMEYCAYAASREPVMERNDAVVSELAYGDIVFRAVRTASDSARTVYPFVKTNYTMPFTTGQINEWTHVESLEAVINGGGRDKFGLSFFATDYAVNKDRYHHSKNIEVQLSGIAQVLDISTMHEAKDGDGPKYSEDFCAYIPNKEMAGLAGFDFVGVLKDHREIKLLEDNSAEGYIMNVQLLNIPEEPDAFTIDMFVNKENMRFTGLKNGMKLTGCFQLQGQLVNE
jgi:hypothetical protein